VISRALEVLQAAVRRRRDLLSDDRGSLPLALLIIAVGMALAAGILPTLLVQDRATVFDNTRLDNLAAAESGIQVVAGKIRASTLATSVGNAAALPCATAANPITGTVNGTGNAMYSVVVSYFVNDPVANPPPPAGTNQPMVCSPGAGVYDAASGSFVPSYALVVSTGTDGATATNGGSQGRTVTSTYVFQTSNRNVAGGVIRIYPSGSSNWCLDAGGSPVAGTPVTLQMCSATTPPIGEQTFSYRSDLTIQLSPTMTPTLPNGLCLDTDVSSGAPVAGKPIILEPCQALAVAPARPPYEQQWSFDDYGAFQAALSTSAITAPSALNNNNNLSSLCMQANQAAAAPVVLAPCDNNVTSTAQAWLPAPTVGDGQAAAPQLVNYQQFGRCLDITGKSVASTKNIAYPCKQNPFPGGVAWNQKWTFTAAAAGAPGTLSTLDTDSNNAQYCLTSPRTEGGYVILTACSVLGAAAPAAELWTQPGNTQTTPYAQRYTFVDSSTDAQRCLGISAPPSGDNSQWYYITVTTCNGSTAQKWNGDPNLGLSVFQNELETH
jgi:hypothetical protein